MPCTTILVGKNASYDGSTIIARNDDSGAGSYTPKKYVVVKPEEQPRIYKSEISHVEIELPDDPMRYTCVPNALAGEGIGDFACENRITGESDALYRHAERSQGGRNLGGKRSEFCKCGYDGDGDHNLKSKSARRGSTGVL